MKLANAKHEAFAQAVAVLPRIGNACSVFSAAHSKEALLGRRSE